MKNSHAFLTAAGVSFLASAGATLLVLNRQDEARAAQPALEANTTSEQLTELQTTVADLGQRVENLASQMDTPLESSGSRVSLSEVERLVDQVLEARGLTGDQLAGEAAPDQAEEKFDVNDLALRLRDGNLSDQERSELWAKAKAAGQEDELIAWFQEQAEGNPNDPGLQVDLANVYFQKLSSMPDGPLKGQVAMMADMALDRALELDDHHWEARFTKAVALSFWPPNMGKQQEAINHFEMLVQQQAEVTPSPEHASTHLLLGNMYAQTGRQERALEAWQQGAELFPDNEELQGQIQAHQQN